jgi:hypothetical protein
MVLRVLGWLWAAPVTLCGLVYALLFWALGWHKWHAIEGDALVWTLNLSKAPVKLLLMWEGWGGHTIGNVVVLKRSPDDGPREATTLLHEQQHVRQCMVLGAFQPIVYGLIMLCIKLACKNSHPYYDNSFEVDARRGAGQDVDVYGRLLKEKN